jgi:hypothetical protein
MAQLEKEYHGHLGRGFLFIYEAIITVLNYLHLLFSLRGNTAKVAVLKKRKLTGNLLPPTLELN